MSREEYRGRVAGEDWLLDTPNMLAVPAAQLREAIGRVSRDEQLLVDSAIDFLLRGCRGAERGVDSGKGGGLVLPLAFASLPGAPGQPGRPEARPP
jgi:hypothetical protein